MNIEELRKIKNKTIAQQNELMYLEMEACSERASKLSWLPDLLARFNCDEKCGILVLLSSIPDQVGTLWYGTWLSDDRSFYEFVVATSAQDGSILEVESWVRATPEVSTNKPGIGKTPAYIALELLSNKGVVK